MKKIEGYFYASRTDWYLKPATWAWFNRWWGPKESADTYHGKVLTQPDAAKLISLKQTIDLNDLEHVVPYPIARDLILQEPLPSIAVLECPCRAQKKDSCQPNLVCLVMGEPFVSFAIDHQPGRSRRISIEEALQIIKEEEERGHIHTAWFKEVMHNRFYAICNCCPCCCLGMKSYFRGVKRLTHSGYTPQVERDSCIACGVCASICPFKAIHINDEEVAQIDTNLCMGCGLCTYNFPRKPSPLI